MDIPVCGVDVETSYAEYCLELERLVATGLKVTISDHWQFMAKCQKRPFKVIERATGGAGVTKFYEIQVQCRALNSKILEVDKKICRGVEMRGLVPEEFQDVQDAVNYCARTLVDLGLDPEPRLVGMWDDTSAFVSLSEYLPDPFDILSAIKLIQQNRADFPIPLMKTVGNFESFLQDFDEDSVHQIAGRIFGKVNNLFGDRGGQTLFQKYKFNRFALAELHSIGRLHERLIWKVKYELAAAKGIKADVDAATRAAGSIKRNTESKLERRLSLLTKMEEVLDQNPAFASAGIKVLSEVALKECKKADAKLWSQGAGQVAQYLIDLKVDPKYRARMMALITKTA